MYFINVKMKKPSLCYCFTWIIFIELNFTVVFLVIRKTWEDRFAGKMCVWEILQDRGDPNNGGLISIYGL